MATCKVDNQGRIVLPAKWREAQGVTAGCGLVVLEEEGRLVIQTRIQAVREAQAMVKKAIRGRVSLVDALLRERRGEVAREEAVAAGRRRKRA